MKLQTPSIVLYGYVWFLLAGPPFFYSLFYALYYADAMGDSSDYHCVVDLTSAAKMEKPIPLDYKAAGVSTEGLPDFIAKNPEKYQDITESWRGMMLFDATSKNISMIINDRFQGLLKEVGIEEQNGFSGRRGCADENLCIRQVLKSYGNMGSSRGSWVMFVNLVKAFDSVPRNVLFTVLAKFGVLPHLIRVIKRMYADLEVTFDLGG